MKLTKFDAETAPKSLGRGSASVAAITFSKSGTISLNRPAIALLELSEGDKISLAQDEENPSDWYLYKDAENGFALRTKDYAKSNQYTFNHKALQTSFCECFSFDAETTFRFLVAGKPTVVKGDKTKYYGILTSNN
jgi:hypothetical protein